MWDNIGGKIKGLAKIIALLGIISSIIGGIVFFNIDGSGMYVGIGFATIFLGSLFSWIASWFMYGFGELIENSESIKYNTSKISDTSRNKPINESFDGNVSKPRTPSGDTWICKHCGTINSTAYDSCEGCGRA